MKIEDSAVTVQYLYTYILARALVYRCTGTQVPQHYSLQLIVPFISIGVLLFRLPRGYS